MTYSSRSSYIADSGTGPKSIKLIPTLHDKKNYIVHYRALKYYVELGLLGTKIHKVMTFEQKPWLKPYIEFNSPKRKLATHSFDRHFFKLLNNSVYGKTMENLRKRTNVRLATKPEQVVNYAKRPSMQYFYPMAENLAVFQMRKIKLILDRPIYVGFSILDISKEKMYRFHYGFIRVQLPESQLLMTDTDSLMYHIPSDRVYSVMGSNLHLFDTSSYPKSHACYSQTNASIPGTFKDELSGRSLLEYVGLRAKMYSYVFLDENGQVVEAKIGKGISKQYLINQLTHEAYKKTLKEKKISRVRVCHIRCKDHVLYTVEINKVGLSYNDDKRFILEDGINTLPYGHYSLRE